MRVPKDNTEAELDAFNAICSRLAGFSERVNPEWVDGYLTALAAGPLQMVTDDWLPRMCGDAFERAFADPDDVAQARAALIARALVLADQLDPEWLLDVPDSMRLQPLVWVWDEASRAEAVTEGWISADDSAGLLTGKAWSEGFFDALDDFAEDWPDPDEVSACEVKADLLQHVQALILPDGDALQAHLNKWHPGRTLSRNELIDEACFAIQDLRVWWLDHAPKPATRHVGPTPGRNDPCPCGSGKKFKKCHGANA